MELATLEVQVLPRDGIDAAATTRVLNGAFRRHAILSRDRTSEAGIWDELHASSRLIQIRDASGLVGTATITPAVDAQLEEAMFPGLNFERAIYFGMAGVRPDRMGQGAGARLLSECERIGGEEGYERVLLMTVEEMGNVVYYQRFGYTTVGVRPLPEGHWGLTVPTHEHSMMKAIQMTNAVGAKR